jgi:hypothetical protein
MAGAGSGAERASGTAFAAGLGGVAGLALNSRRGPKAAVGAAVVGAVALAAVDAWSRARLRPNEIPRLPGRIMASGSVAAPLGWLAGRFTRLGPLAIGTAAGTAAGRLGVRAQ